MQVMIAFGRFERSVYQMKSNRRIVEVETIGYPYLSACYVIVDLILIVFIEPKFYSWYQYPVARLCIQLWYC